MLSRIKECSSVINADIAMVTNLLNLFTYLIFLLVAAAHHLAPLSVLCGIMMLLYVFMIPVSLKVPRMQLNLVYVLNYAYMVCGVSLYGLNFGFEIEAFFAVSTTAYFIYLAKGVDEHCGYIHFFAALYSITFLIQIPVVHFLGSIVPETMVIPGSQYAMKFTQCLVIGSQIIYYQVKLHKVVNVNEETLKSGSERDALTGLYNRGKTQQVLKNEFERTRDSYAPFHVAMVDIDDFKKINDVYGHNAGDYVLRSLGGMMVQLMREFGVTVGRWGGEEFVIMSSASRNPNDFYRILESLRNEIAHHEFIFDDKQLPVTVTIGMASRNGQYTSHEAMVDAADTLMYKGKYEGKNRVEQAPENLRDFNKVQAM